MMIVDKKKYPNVYAGHEYALGVVAKKILACKYVIGACERYLRDIQNKSANFYFDIDEAEKYLRLVQKFDHVIGTWKTKNIIYEPWQCFIWMNIMGFKMKDTKFRRFRTAHIEVARGNSKSAMSSQAVLYFLALDNPNGNQISTAATKKDQARIVLDSARNMASKNQSFRKKTGVIVYAHSIEHPKSYSVARALASEHQGLDGLNDVLAVCDELHAMNRETFEAITTGMSKRADSLTLCITTAGSDIHSVGHSQSSYAKKICMDEFQDDQFFGIVYTIDDGDDWADEKNWIKANPNLDISVDLRTFRAKVRKAVKTTPADIPGIRIKNLNEWIGEAKAYFNLRAWDDCKDTTLKIEDFKNEYCRTAIDLASNVDLTSFGIIFKDKKDNYVIFDKSFIPQGAVDGAKNNDLYKNCIATGHLIPTPGSAINYDFIRKEMEDFSNQNRIMECFYDPWNATETAQKLALKIEMVKMGMNVANLSEPMKKFDAFLRSGQIRHNGSPLLRWCLGNVVAKEDHNQNVFPRKSHVDLKIDPIVALLMALAGWLQDRTQPSVYEERGLLRL